jgi:hypothetical protein
MNNAIPSCHVFSHESAAVIGDVGRRPCGSSETEIAYLEYRVDLKEMKMKRDSP